MSLHDLTSGIPARTRFAFIALLSLYLSFGHNFFHAVNPDKFYNTGGTSEALVIARMAETRESGLLSHQARMGRYMKLDGEIETDQGVINANQMKKYLGRSEGGDYEPYNSQFGLQGVLFSIIDEAFTRIGVDVDVRHRLYISLVALLFALVLTAILLLLYEDIGLTACGLILASIVFSRWQVYYAKNMYFMLPVMFLPMLAVFYACRSESRGRPLYLQAVSLLVMLLVMADALMGYEYISTVMLAALAPLVYYWIRDGWSDWRFALRLITVGLFALFGFILAFVVHLGQLELAFNNFADAFDVIRERILVRTYTDPQDYVGTAYYESQKTSVFYVLYVYLLKGGTFRLKLPFLLWILMLAHITRKEWVCMKAPADDRERIIKALVITAWFSLLAPLSWIILAKSHSEIHTHINYIVWHLPFMLFAFAVFGVYWEKQINAGIARLRNRIRHVFKLSD